MEFKVSKSSEPEISGLLAKLKAYKSLNEGDASTLLPECGVNVTFPKFINHGRWMKAMRLSQGDMARAQGLLVIDVCRFDGERMTLEDFEELIPAQDGLHLLGEVMAGGDDVGNVPDPLAAH
jgi:hypothetical protein